MMKEHGEWKKGAQVRSFTRTLVSDARRQQSACRCLALAVYCYVLLLDREGQVLWKVEGTFTPEKDNTRAARVRAWQSDEAE